MRRPQDNSIKEAWFLFLVLGIVMLNFPFIQIFNRDQQIFGIPLLVCYFFIGWPISILIIRYFVRQINPQKPQQNDQAGRRKLP